MAKNHMAEVAKMLGVELGEEFEITNSIHKYKIDVDGFKAVDSCSEVPAPTTFIRLLRGDKDNEIVRRPWKPKLNTKYWTVTVSRDGITDIAPVSQYDGDEFDFNNILMSNCFPTREAAEAAAPEIVKFYEDVRKMVEEE